MAEIIIPGPGSVRQVDVARDPGVRADANDFGAQIGSAMSELGQVVSRIGSQLHAQIQEPRDRVGLMRWKLDREEALFKSFEEAKTGAPAGAPGFAEGLRNRWQAESGATDWSKYGLSRKAQQQAQLSELGMIQDYTFKALTWERNESVRQLGSDTEKSVVRLVESAIASGDYERAWAGINESLSAAGGALTPEQEEIVRKAAQESLWRGVLERDPEQALEMLGLSGAAKPSSVGRHEAGAYDRASRVQARLMTKGWSAHASAAIAGGLIQESGVQSGGPSGDSGTASGMAQWRGGRLDNLKAFATSQGKDWTDFDTQVDFIDWELRNTEKDAGDALMNATTLDEAAEAAIGYERPQGWSRGNPRAGHGWDNRYAAAQRLAGNDVSQVAPMFADISIDRRFQLANQADVRIARNQAKRRAQFVDELSDYDAFLRSGNADDGRYDLGTLQDMLGEEEGAAAFGELNDAAALGEDVNTTKWATPDELNAMVAERQATLQSPEGFRRNVQDLNGLAAVIKERNTALVNDPASYVLQDSTIAADYEKATSGEADERQSAIRDYAAGTLALQARLGLLPDQQRILPKSAVQNIVSEFRAQPEGGQNAAQLMVGLEAQWGKYWPQVFGELSEDLPATALVVGAMNRPGQEMAAERLAESAKLGTKALEEALAPDVLKPIRDGLNAKMADFAGTLVNNPGGVNTLLTFQEGVYQLALTYAGEGDTGRALSRAYEDVLGKAYTIKDTYRVPIEHDADMISTNADRILRGMDEANIALPTSLAGLSEDETRTAYMKSLRANGFWVTKPDESGLMLYDATRHAVLTTDGKLVSATWQEIIDLGGTQTSGLGSPGRRPYR